MILSSLLALSFQGSLSDLKKADLPPKAHCVVCVANGNDHGLEKPVAGVTYKGNFYYFCHSKELAEFKKDPEAFMPMPVPRPVTAFSVTDTAGKAWTQETKGVTLVDFWATWCGPCKEQMPTLDKLQEAFAPKGFNVLSISIDEKKADFDKFVAKRKFVNPVAWDNSENWSKFKVRVIPALFLIKDGQIVAEWKGKQKPEVLRKAIEAALAK